MKKTNAKKRPHLTFDERLEIQECLSHGMCFKDIARRIGKAQTTVSREVKRHITITNADVVRKDKDGNIINEPCKLLLKPPFVCNPCKKRRTACPFAKHIYYAKNAQKEYETLLSDAREGIPLTKQDFYDIDRTVSECIANGQHLYHILQTHDLGVSKTTIYRHLQKGLLSVKPIDFPRVVKFKARVRKSPEYVPKGLKVGRTYADFLHFKAENELSSWVEIDTVIGRVGGKTILTFDFVPFNFMFGLLLEKNTASEVEKKLQVLKAKLSDAGKRFGDIFPLGLTDNGGEFANVFAFEVDLEGEFESKLFFCDPLQSNQKPHVEKNHTLFRDIVPRGQSFDNFTQDTVSLIFSHVNSVKRKLLNGKTPFDMFVFLYGNEIAALLDIEKIPAEQVIQSPKLLKS